MKSAVITSHPTTASPKSRPSKPQPIQPEVLQDSSKESMIERLDSIFSVLRATKMSMSACHAIIQLYLATGSKKESVILSTLAGKIGITTAGITNVADCMESHGLAKRQQDPKDRRVTIISLTPKGRSFAESFGALTNS